MPKGKTQDVYSQNKCLDHNGKQEKKETECSEPANSTSPVCVRKSEQVGQLKTQLIVLETCNRAIKKVNRRGICIATEKDIRDITECLVSKEQTFFKA